MASARTALLAAVALAGLAACAPPATQDDADARTRPQAEAAPHPYFVNLVDGDTVTSPFRVVFGLAGMGVAPAGVDAPHTGHHHLLVDTTLAPEEMAYAIPADEHHRHFGGGQTEVVLDLPPGEHTLQLVMGDAGHVPLDPPAVSDVITVTVR